MESKTRSLSLAELRSMRSVHQGLLAMLRVQLHIPVGKREWNMSDDEIRDAYRTASSHVLIIDTCISHMERVLKVDEMPVEVLE